MNNSNVRKAIILAAGRGRRLSNTIHSMQPKILLTFGGKTLLERHIENLEQVGVEEIYIVIGYQHEKIENFLKKIRKKTIKSKIFTIFNEDYMYGSIVSLSKASHVLESGERMLLMDGDVLYSPEILLILTKTKFENCLLLDMNIEAGDEPVKICLEDDLIVDFAKLPEKNFTKYGESVGFFLLSKEISIALSHEISNALKKGQIINEYEDPLRNLIINSKGKTFCYENISGLPWIEIDFPQDIENANKLILESKIK
ncbi:NTP transferase domain-containing protein [Pantoea ananatis]|jgi:choline kinase|uniref:phosphocholine cytidylyltransferase family protein n=1 Tax=Pantoea ananas TaxID=553 RepID=UPI00059C21AD|nr:phosphocholine cytidylyltransferase family protein [Pantoea ananatis]MDJ0029817.1 phosphocholine cytidylyltransferase family protein [Pantoea ananatis]MDJ0045372.1 phosphocholine cytidylyltransferase family protein [Pantoea ananatis]NCU09150.1 NTP transferase domain-containing protein [Pantoea ananatis]UEG16562.1 phosphocholine cytidylyltransferase family protein [Pantoea ananatis]SFX01447.1 Choline kinase [Pantoea ananatis]